MCSQEWVESPKLPYETVQRANQSFLTLKLSKQKTFVSVDDFTQTMPVCRAHATKAAANASGLSEWLLNEIN
jgi:hypothetical protein